MSCPCQRCSWDTIVRGLRTRQRRKRGLTKSDRNDQIPPISKKGIMMNPEMSRREMLKTLGVGAVTVVAAPLFSMRAADTPAAAPAPAGKGFELPTLPYAYDALEPHIDARTMEIHYTKHHQAYVTNLNKALEGHADLQSKSVEQLLKSI